MSARVLPWWGVVSSAVPPVVLAAGWTIGASLQTRPYDPVADTVSALAGTGATDRWVMTLAFVVAGVCEVVTGGSHILWAVIGLAALAVWPLAAGNTVGRHRAQGTSGPNDHLAVGAC